MLRFTPLSESQNPHWRQLSLNTNDIDGAPLAVWEDVRYVIEWRLYMHKELKKGNPVYSYIKAQRWTPEFRWSENGDIQSYEELQNGEAIVIRRLPIPPGIHRFTPVRFDPSQNFSNPITDDMTEEEKIAAIQQASVDTFRIAAARKRQSLKHASEYQVGEHGVIPPDSYVCNGCGARGAHFRRNCPKPKEEALDRKVKTTGIPYQFLRQAEEGESRMRDTDGRTVKRVMKRVNEVHNIVLTESEISDSKYDFNFEAYLDKRDDIEAKVEADFFRAHPKLRNKNNICQYFLRGLCQKTKAMCPFIHGYDLALMPLCHFYNQGECTNADCLFRHKTERKRKRRECPDYRDGFCAKGPRCRYEHAKVQAIPGTFPRWKRQLMAHCLSFK